jgi:hypothetical protein
MAWLGEELPAEQQGGATPFAPRTVKDLIEAVVSRRQILLPRLRFPQPAFVRVS